jgi:hypothetical protein
MVQSSYSKPFKVSSPVSCSGMISRKPQSARNHPLDIYRQRDDGAGHCRYKPFGATVIRGNAASPRGAEAVFNLRPNIDFEALSGAANPGCSRLSGGSLFPADASVSAARDSLAEIVFRSCERDIFTPFCGQGPKMFRNPWHSGMLNLTRFLQSVASLAIQ